jgi:dihydrodipicolinate synthase/N-acetylneuraminate lyase
MEKRRALIKRLFPEGIPQLWCPPLTHYTGEGKIDLERMAAHLGYMSQWIKTYLVPGSTGDGWEMTEDEIRQVLIFNLDIAAKHNIQFLIGVLTTDAETTHERIVETLSWLQERTGIQNEEEMMKKTGACGFTVCPPQGSSLSQEQIYHALVPILELGVPIALYQLPQVTENEMSPETVGRLAAEFSNFYLFKDSSGYDKVALSGLELNGVHLLRGAEGNYHKWLRTNEGNYDGFLLGSANCFARELKTILHNLSAGNFDAARSLSERVWRVVDEASNCVADFPSGNPFANANKAIDHFLAYGAEAINIVPPRIHSGARLSTEIIKMAGESLTRNDLMPSNGYLQTKSK